MFQSEHDESMPGSESPSGRMYLEYLYLVLCFDRGYILGAFLRNVLRRVWNVD